MVTARSVALALLALTLVPLASAESDTAVSYSGFVNSDPAGTFWLNGTGGGSDIALPQGIGVVWAIREPLAAGAQFHDHTFESDAYLHSFATSAVTATLGFIPAGGDRDDFVAFPGCVVSAPVQRSNRTVIPSTLTLPITKAPVVDIGRAHGTVVCDGTYLPGSYRAVELKSTADNQVYTTASLLNSPHVSTASIPLPELSGAVLFAMGSALVAGVVLVRRRGL